MTEPSGWDVSPEKRSSSMGSGSSTPVSPRALWIVVAGHVLVLIAAVTGSVAPKTAIVAAIACSIVAVAALKELAPSAMRVRRAVTALTSGHVVAAAVMLAGLAPSVPWSIPLSALAAAAALDIASLAAVRHAATVNRQPRPLTVAPRVAAIVLVVQALLQRGADSATRLSMPLRAAIFLALAALGVALLASFSIIALRVRPRWAIAGLLAWTVGWVALTADLSSLILWSLGGPFPMGPHQLSQLDAELVQIVATAGGLVIGAALVTSIHEARFRHSAVVLLAGYALFGLLAAVAEHRIDLATDFPGISALRKDRDLADTIRAFPLAGVLWLYWRRVAAAHRRRRRAEHDDDLA
jgi:hypothetical protein